MVTLDDSNTQFLFDFVISVRSVRFPRRLSLIRTGFGRMVAAAKPLSLETEHPYTNNADWKETVRIEGAKKLIITFDDRSRRA